MFLVSVHQHVNSSELGLFCKFFFLFKKFALISVGNLFAASYLLMFLGLKLSISKSVISKSFSQTNFFFFFMFLFSTSLFYVLCTYYTHVQCHCSYGLRLWLALIVMHGLALQC